MASVFNQNKVDFTKQSMFFGEDHMQRYDEFKYPIFDKLTQKQLEFLGGPEEISLQKDRNDYNELRPEQKHIFTSNLKYQILLDSVQGRGLCTSIFTSLFDTRTRRLYHHMGLHGDNSQSQLHIYD